MTDATPNTTDRATRHDVVSVHEAAAILGITEDSVRARLRRGSLPGAKEGSTWVVHLDRDAEHDTSRDTTRSATRHDTTSRDAIEPLAEAIRDLTQRNEELSAAAAMWQTRAAHLEQQLLQLTAGEPEPKPVQESAPAAPGSPQANESPEGGIRSWWRRFWGI